jgi:hypothetical protein
MPATLTLDGEVAMFDAELVSRFEWLRHLNHETSLPRRCSLHSTFCT